MDTGGPICVDTLPLATIFPSRRRSPQPRLPAALSARASLAPAWTCAVASQLPDSVLWPTGPFSQREPRALRDTQIRQPTLLLQAPLWLPTASRIKSGFACSPAPPCHRPLWACSVSCSRACRPSLPPRPALSMSPSWTVSHQRGPGPCLPPGTFSELRPGRRLLGAPRPSQPWAHGVAPSVLPSPPGASKPELPPDPSQAGCACGLAPMFY